MSSNLKKCRDCGLEANSVEELELFATDKDLPKGRKNYCKVCHSRASIDRCRENREANKIKIKEYLGGAYKCKDCGFEHEYLGIFDWHHLDPTEKDDRVSRFTHYTWKSLLKEIEKCVFLCANCHRLRHKKDK